MKTSDGETGVLSGEALVDVWRKRLGVKNTTTRLAILRTVASLSGHFDAEELMARSREIQPRVSRATVYRLLPLLVEKEILQASEFGDGYHRYSRRDTKTVPTAEIFIAETGQIVEVPAPFLTWYADAVAVKAGYELIGQRLQVFARVPRKKN